MAHLTRLPLNRRAAAQALEEVGLRQSVAPPPQPSVLSKYDVHDRRSQSKSRFESKVEKWRETKQRRRNS